MKSRLKNLPSVILVLLLLLAITELNAYYRATDLARQRLEGSAGVTVTITDFGYFFDGSGDKCAMIFYPGANVEEAAYSGIMTTLAENGTDCFLVKMPMHLAFLGKAEAAGIIKRYDYDRWYIGGHSLGGAMAAEYCAEHSSDFDGLVMLGAFSRRKVPDSVPAVVIRGSNDTVLREDLYRINQANNPADSRIITIEGGNHSGFGDYGAQKGDGPAEITPEEQQEITAEAILDLTGSR